MAGFELAGQRFTVPAPAVGVADADGREMAGMVLAGEARVGDDLIAYRTAADAACWPSGVRTTYELPLTLARSLADELRRPNCRITWHPLAAPLQTVRERKAARRTARRQV